MRGHVVNLKGTPRVACLPSKPFFVVNITEKAGIESSGILKVHTCILLGITESHTKPNNIGKNMV